MLNRIVLRGFKCDKRAMARHSLVATECKYIYVIQLCKCISLARFNFRLN